MLLMLVSQNIPVGRFGRKLARFIVAAVVHPRILVHAASPLALSLVT